MVCRLEIALLASALFMSVALLGCDSGPPSTALDQLLPSAPGSDLPSALITQQDLDESATAKATPLDSGSMRTFLTGAAFQGAYSRVWGAGQTFVTTLVVRFGTRADASRFLAFQRGGIGTGANTFVSDHPAIPGSFVFVLDGTSAAAGSAPQFCNGVWFTRANDAFESLVCGASPQWATEAEDLAASEYSLANQALPA